MDIILLQDVDKVGDKHTIATVKDGYGRNYLIPQRLAIIANDTNRRRLNEVKRIEDAKEAKKRSFYQEIADKFGTQILKIGAKAGTSGKIFGSVTNVQLAMALNEQFGVEVDRRKIIISDEVKELGTYKAVLSLHKEVQPEISFEVVAE